ncbi:MAG: hypothetical protein R6T89_06150 [Candidatus Syntrophosphaera sp.]
MKKGNFKAVFLLALLFPLVSGYLGYLLNTTGFETPGQPASTYQGQYAETGEPVPIYNSGDETRSGSKDAIGFRELILYIALLMGVIAFLYHYLGTSLAWIAVILLPLGFSLLYLARVPLPLTVFYLVNLAFAALLALLVRYLFFLPSIIRFRMIVSSLAGAALLTLYMRSLYLITGTTFEPQRWTGTFVSGLILFVFVTFGMSMADMVIQRAEFKRLQAEQQRIEDEEDEDLNA